MGDHFPWIDSGRFSLMAPSLSFDLRTTLQKKAAVHFAEFFEALITVFCLIYGENSARYPPVRDIFPFKIAPCFCPAHFARQIKPSI